MWVAVSQTHLVKIFDLPYLQWNVIAFASECRFCSCRITRNIFLHKVKDLIATAFGGFFVVSNDADFQNSGLKWSCLASWWDGWHWVSLATTSWWVIICLAWPEFFGLRLRRLRWQAFQRLWQWPFSLQRPVSERLRRCWQGETPARMEERWWASWWRRYLVVGICKGDGVLN